MPLPRVLLGLVRPKPYLAFGLWRLCTYTIPRYTRSHFSHSCQQFCFGRDLSNCHVAWGFPYACSVPHFNVKTVLCWYFVGKALLFELLCECACIHLQHGPHQIRNGLETYILIGCCMLARLVLTVLFNQSRIWLRAHELPLPADSKCCTNSVLDSF